MNLGGGPVDRVLWYPIDNKRVTPYAPGTMVRVRTFENGGDLRALTLILSVEQFGGKTQQFHHVLVVKNSLAEMIINS